MASNKRIFYAIEQLAIKPDGQGAWSSSYAVHGVQSCGMTTNFNLNQVFEVGQLSIYANIEDLPDIQVTVSKVLDGYPLVYHLATTDALTPTLVGRSTSKCVVGLSVYPDTNTSASTSAAQQVECSGQFVSSVAYRFEVDGNGTEDVTLAGNNRIWANNPGGRIQSGEDVSGTQTGYFTTNADVPAAAVGISRRQHINFTPVGGYLGDANGAYKDPDCTILPTEVEGINSSGINPGYAVTDGSVGAHIQSISTNCDFNRTALNQLGQFGPYTRFVNFPVQVTCEIAVLSASGDLISATERGILSTGTGCGAFRGNLNNQTIRIATCEGTRIYLGLKNKLQSVNYTGGDTGGGNVTTTYSYRNFNDFTVIHSGDPNASGTAWWTARSGYLSG